MTSAVITPTPSITSANMTNTSASIEINEMILRLDALATGYEEILHAAKTQLENLELTESDWGRLANSLQSRINYHTLAIHLATLLESGLRAANAEDDNATATASDETLVAKLVIERLDYLLRKRIIDGALKEMVKHEIQDLLAEAKLNIIEQAEVATQIKLDTIKRDELRDAWRKEALIKDLLADTFLGEIRDMVTSAVVQHKTTEG